MTLSFPQAQVGQDLGDGDHPGPRGLGELGGGVDRAVVEDEDLVHQAGPLDQVTPDGGHDGADGGRLVAGREAHGHPDTEAALPVGELAGVRTHNEWQRTGRHG